MLKYVVIVIAIALIVLVPAVTFADSECSADDESSSVKTECTDSEKTTSTCSDSSDSKSQSASDHPTTDSASTSIEAPASSDKKTSEKNSSDDQSSTDPSTDDETGDTSQDDSDSDTDSSGNADDSASGEDGKSDEGEADDNAKETDASDEDIGSDANSSDNGDEGSDENQSDGSAFDEENKSDDNEKADADLESDDASASDIDLSDEEKAKLAEDGSVEVTNGEGNSYIAEITSDKVVATDTAGTSFTVQFDNLDENIPLGSFQLTLPEGFTDMALVEDSIKVLAAELPNGEAKTWLGSVVDLVLSLWALDESSYLGQDESIAATFTATTPEIPTGYNLATQAWTDNSTANAYDDKGVATNTQNMAEYNTDPMIFALDQDNPFRISTAEHFNAIRHSPWGNYTQTADFTLHSWAFDGPIGTTSAPFRGSYNGNGYTISGLSLQRPSDSYVGLFGVTTNANISNVNLTVNSVLGIHYVGGLVGHMIFGTINNCTVIIEGSGIRGQGTFDGSQTGDYVGGLVGYNSGGTITNSSVIRGNRHDIQGDGSYVGGLVGYNLNGAITNCHTDVTVTGYDYYVGGLVGYNSGGTITDSSTDGLTWTLGHGGSPGKQGDYVGGLVGLNREGTIINCHTRGIVYSGGVFQGGQFFGGDCVGGLVGWNSNGTIQDSSAIGTVRGDGNEVGGLVGRSSGEITGSYASGSVTNHTNRALWYGGLVGINWGMIIDSFSTATVRGNEYVGGLAGSNEDLITNSYASGRVDAMIRMGGGLVGYNIGEVIGSYATGEVYGGAETRSHAFGGLVGSNTGNISYCYAIGSVRGAGSIGGLVGNNGGIITNCYAAGSLSKRDVYTLVGGLVATDFEAEGTIINSYWDTQNSGDSNSPYGTGRTTVQMQQSGTFSSWSISNQGGDDTTWRIYPGFSYPLLRSFMTEVSAAKVYNGDALICQFTDFMDSELNPVAIDFALEVNGVFADRNVGACVISLSFGPLGDENAPQRSALLQKYDFMGQGEITARDLTITSFFADDKIYDGTTEVVNFGFLSSGYIYGDDLGFSLDFAFEDKHVGSDKTVYFNDIALTGGDAGNYHLVTNTGTALAAIIARPITVTAVGHSKVYDGTANSSVLPVITGDLVGGDTAVWTQTFDTKDVDTDKTITPAGTITDGNNGNNYEVTFISVATGEITPRPLTLSNFVADNKVYDGTTVVTGDGFDDDRIPGDDLEFNYDVAFEDKNVGDDKDVDFTNIAISGGDDQDNYILVATEGTAKADISARDLILSDFVADDKTYDGNTDVTGDGFDDDRVTGDELTFSYNVAFEDKNVGTDKDVNFTNIAISGGDDQGNYTLVTTFDTATADITARDLTLTAFVADSKVYDGTTDVTGYGFEDDRVTGNELTFSYNVAFEDKNVGTDKDVNFTSITISGGADRDNYNLVTTSGTATADITARDLTLSNFTANSKVYDGTTVVTGYGFDDDRTTGDVLDFSYDVAFEDKNVGRHKEVNFTNISISGGADAGNYNLVTTEGTATANITPRSLTITAINIVKLFGETYTFAGTEISAEGLVDGDRITFAVITSKGAEETARIGDYTINISDAEGKGLKNYDITYIEGIMSVVIPILDDGISDPVTVPTLTIDRALTTITGGAEAIITPAFITTGSPADLALAITAYQALLQRYEEENELLTAGQSALIETELAIALAAILALEALLLEQDGEPYDLEALIEAYETAEEILERNEALLSAGQVMTAHRLLQAIAKVIDGLTA